MREIFWYFLIYSFLGFLLEIIFAYLTHSPKPDRKCHLIFPVCPVYGLGALVILALPTTIKEIPFLLYLAGGLAATASEWLMAVFYEKVAGVAFWNYYGLPLNVNGRICLWFSLFWGLLALPLVYWLHPLTVSLVAVIPPALSILFAAIYLADSILSLAILRRHGTCGLRWYLGFRPNEVR